VAAWGREAAGSLRPPAAIIMEHRMFNDRLEAAMAFYTTTFPDSEIKTVARTGKDGPMTWAEVVVGGQSIMGYNGGPYYNWSEGRSVFVDCRDQLDAAVLERACADAERRPDPGHGAHTGARWPCEVKT
jgi:predicted 3-demethylubiquinone-9 3-methyltransferase (glyoxalase superfamily)